MTLHACIFKNTKKHLHFQQNFIISVTRNNTFCIWKNNFFFKIFFWNFQKKNFHQISPNYDQKRGFPKIRKKNFWKKIFFFSHIFFENRNKIAKNRSINTMVTIPNRQDFKVFRLYRFFWIWANSTIVNGQKTRKNFQKKFFFSNAECVVSGHWNNEILLKMQILFCILEDTSM